MQAHMGSKHMHFKLYIKKIHVPLIKKKGETDASPFAYKA